MFLWKKIFEIVQDIQSSSQLSLVAVQQPGQQTTFFLHSVSWSNGFALLVQ
jgi:hypothetical protein